MRPGLHLQADPLRLVAAGVDDAGNVIALEFALTPDAALGLAAHLQMEALRAAGRGAVVAMPEAEPERRKGAIQ